MNLNVSTNFITPSTLAVTQVATLQALTYDVRRERDREKKEFMRGGAAALIQACLLRTPSPETATPSPRAVSLLWPPARKILPAITETSKP